jgi:hypothetical protein
LILSKGDFAAWCERLDAQQRRFARSMMRRGVLSTNALLTPILRRYGIPKHERVERILEWLLD